MLIFSIQLITPEQQADDMLFHSQKEIAIHFERLRAEHPTKQEDRALQLCHSHCIPLCNPWVYLTWFCLSCYICFPFASAFSPRFGSRYCLSTNWLFSGLGSNCFCAFSCCPVGMAELCLRADSIVRPMSQMAWIYFPFSRCVSPALSQCSLFSPSFVSAN